MPRIGKLMDMGDYFAGEITTLSLRLRLKLIPNTERDAGVTSDAAPDFLAYSKGVEIGAAWVRTESEPAGIFAFDYLSLHLDDPFWPASIDAVVYRNRLKAFHLDIVWARRTPAAAGHHSACPAPRNPTKT